MARSEHAHPPFRFATLEGGQAFVALLKTHAAIITVALALLGAGVAATWHVTGRIQDGDSAVRQSVHRAETRVREDIGEIRQDVGELRDDIQENYRDLRDRLETLR